MINLKKILVLFYISFFIHLSKIISQDYTYEFKKITLKEDISKYHNEKIFLENTKKKSEIEKIRLPNYVFYYQKSKDSVQKEKKEIIIEKGLTENFYQYETNNFNLRKNKGTTYYSRATGDWKSNTTWSTAGCGGAAASSTPGEAPGDIAIICNGHTVTVTANPANPIQEVTIKNGGTLICGSTGAGLNKRIAISSNGYFIIEGGGTYIHNTDNNAATTVFQGTEIFDPASTVIIKKWDATTTNLISDVSSDFGNLVLEWNTSGNVWQCTGLGTTRAIKGYFTIQNNCGVWLDNTTNDLSITIGGDLTLNNGYLEIKRVPANGNGNVTLNVNGNVSVSGSSSYFYGIINTGTYNYTGNFIMQANNLTISSAAYFYGQYNTNGNAEFNFNGDTYIHGYTSQGANTFYSTFYGIYANSSSLNYGNGTCNFNTNNLTLSNRGRFYGKYMNQIKELPPPSGNFTSTIQNNLIIGEDNSDCFYYGIYCYIDGSSIYGLCSGDVSLNINNDLLVKGSDQYYNFTGTNGNGSVYITINNNMQLNGGSVKLNSYAFIGNHGIINFTVKNLEILLGAILFHSTDVEDGRICYINITNNANIYFANSSEFFLFSNLTGGTQNQVFKFTVGGDLNISGNTSALFRTRAENSNITDSITINGNLIISGGQVLLGSYKNNPLNCEIKGNVTISGGTINCSNNSLSKIDLIMPTTPISWSQTGGTVSLCNLNIKSGKTINLTGNKLGDFLSGHTLTVENNSTLNCDIYPITGGGNFNLQSGATLGIGNINGIESTGAIGNVQVTGTRIYNSNAIYRYYGNQTPQLTGNFITTSDPEIYKLIIDKTNNTDKVNINKGTSGSSSFIITNNLNLINGGLDLNERTLIISNGAPEAITRTNGYIISEQNSSDNNSKLQWNIGSNSGNYTFPFGTVDGYYIPVIINNTSNIGNVTISTRATSSSDNTPWASGVTNMNINQSDGATCCVIDRWWNINATNPAPINITFSYLGRENTMDNPNAEIVIQHWTGTGWNNGKGGINGTYTSTGSNGGNISTQTYSVTAEGLTEFSPYVLVGIPSGPLPVDLINFYGICESPYISIHWQTANEFNCYAFSLQKSKNLIEWENLNLVKCNLYSNYINNYKVIDYQPYIPTTYYQLKQIDIDGNEKLFDIISVSCNESISKPIINIYQNYDGNIIIDYYGNIDFKAKINIINYLGQVIYSKNILLNEFNNKEILSIYSKGIYLVKIISDQEIFLKSNKIVIY